MLRFAICDDEPFMVTDISERLNEYLQRKDIREYSVSEFSTTHALLKSATDFDLIFLDIQMDAPNGMKTAKILRSHGNTSILIFITVLQEYVFDAFEVNAFDYLVKPLQPDRFSRTMDRALAVLAKRPGKTILIKRGMACEVVSLARISYCEIQGRKIFIHKKDGSIIDHYEKMDDFAKRLDDRFFRCHRSYLVNLGDIRSCSGGQLTLSHGEKIPVSRLRESELKQALLHYIKNHG